MINFRKKFFFKIFIINFCNLLALDLMNMDFNTLLLTIL